MANEYADIIGQAQQSSSANTNSSSSDVNSNIEQLLRELSASISQFTESTSKMSQSAVKDSARSRPMYNEESAHSFRTRYNSKSGQGSKRSGKSFEQVLTDSVFGENFKENIDQALKNFGQQLGTKLGGIVKETGFGKSLGNLGEVAAQAAQGQVGLGALAGAAGKAIPAIAAVSAGLLIADKALSAFGPAIEGVKKYWETLKAASNRYYESRQKYIQNATDRFIADVNTMVEAPFKILEEAVNNVTTAWDNNLRVITATQGYEKADVQSLMSEYAARIQEDNLWSVVNASTMIDNLSKVLDAGLSGAVAEEFAYIATVLNAAIPTQDFFGFASTYSSIAANAIKNGYSQADAIKAATEALEEFASNLLYASRDLAGGFSTGLTNASSIFETAVKITQASRTGNISSISGVLTAAQAIIGATAPDLASSITDAIYKAATGGNSSDVVALRSLAGINASNTDFIRALAQDPKSVFSRMFNNLANMYNQSSDAYMEKAEGYASLFGLSPEAFQRIDFNYLASAIDNMNTDNVALGQSLALLQSGQTTLNQEQLKNREINEYLIQEGLSYVLDNEVARAVQQHMWDQELADAMMEASYGVNLEGASMTMLERIGATVQQIADMGNPSAWTRKLANVSFTINESSALKKDLKAILLSGKIGEYNNSEELLALSTYENHVARGTRNLLEMMGYQSRYSEISSLRKAYEQSIGAADLYKDINGDYWGYNEEGVYVNLGPAAGVDQSSLRDYQAAVDAVLDIKSGYLLSRESEPVSRLNTSRMTRYSWGGVSKSDFTSSIGVLASQASVASQAVSDIYGGITSASEEVNQNFADKIQTMLSDEYLVEQFVKQHKSYQDWIDSAEQLGIADFSAAVLNSGLKESDIETYFRQKETELGMQEALRISEDEQDFRDQGRLFWQETFPNGYQVPLFDMLQANTDTLYEILTQNTEFNESWMSFVADWTAAVKSFSDYFIVHKVYNAAYSYDDVKKIQQQEEDGKGDAVLALAEALTQNTVDLKDPAVQTNALLSQILIVIEAIMQQNNTAAGTVSLADTLSALSMGMTNRTV